MNAEELGQLPRLLRRVRRRLRVAWALEWLQLLAPIVAIAAVVLVGSASAGSFDIAGAPLAAVLVAGAMVAVLALALVLRLPERAVAQVADRGLGTKDAFSTALEFPADLEHFGTRIRQRAISLAEASTARAAVGLPWRRRPVIVAAALGPLIVGLSVVTSPRDHERQEHAEASARIDEAVETLEAEADALARSPPARKQPTASMPSPVSWPRRRSCRARELLRHEAAELDQRQRPEALAERAATQGLEHSLASEALPGSDAASPSPAADQFDQLADQLDSLSGDEQAATADRLDSLAATQEAGDPDTAAALATAAEAIRSGDTEGTADALADAADSNRSAAAGAAATAALGEAGAAARQASDSLAADAGTDPGPGQGQGPRRGTGRRRRQTATATVRVRVRAPDRDRDRDRAKGLAAALAPPAGNVSGDRDSDSGGASGQGGAGRVTGDGQASDGDPDEQTPDLATVYDPVHGDRGDQLDRRRRQWHRRGRDDRQQRRSNRARGEPRPARRGDHRLRPAGHGGDGCGDRRAVGPSPRHRLLRPTPERSNCV